MAPPGPEQQKQLLAKIKDEHDDEYTKSRRMAERRELADVLRADARTTRQDDARRFVLLDEARLAAARIPDAALGLEIVDQIARDYDVNALALKIETLEKSRHAKQTPVTAGQLVDTALALLKEVEAADDYKGSEQILATARAAVPLAAGQPKGADVNQAARRLESLRKAFDALAGARAALAKDPKEPAANLALGKFYCFELLDWDKGLPLLARGSDPVLKALAEQEKGEPAEGTAQAALAKAWYKAAEKAGPEQEACKRRAYHWYVEALALLEGTDARTAEQRVQLLLKQIPDLQKSWDNLGTSEAKVMTGYLQLAPGKSLTTRQWYGGPVSITVIARTQKNNIRIQEAHGGMVIFNWEGKAGELRVHRPENADGRQGSLAVSEPLQLTANTWYRLRWVITERGMEVARSLEGAPNLPIVFREAHSYDLLRPGPVKVTAFDSVVDVKSVVVKPLRSRK
jgi:hypothetical protein